MKVKANIAKQTVSIKGMTLVQAALIESLLSHTRLGDGTAASEAALELRKAFALCGELDAFETVKIEVCATTDDHCDNVDVFLASPMLIVCELN